VDATFADLKTAAVSPFGPFDDRTRRVTARYQVDVERQPVAFSAGAELQREQNDDNFITDDAFEPLPVKRTTTGLFAEARPSLGDRVFVTAGVRVDRIAREALATDGLRPAIDSDVVWSPNPKVSAAWFVSAPGASDRTKIHGSAGTGIKPPTGFDIAFTDNPNLKPERSRSGDLGVERSFAGARGVVDATVFANRYEDLIVSIGSTFTGVSRFKTDNVANARARGLELGASWNAGHGMTVRGGWTFLSSEVLGVNTLPDVAPQPFAVGEALIRRPRQSGSLDATWRSPRASAFVTVNGRGQMNDVEPNFGDTVLLNPAYAVVNFGGSFRLVPSIEITGRVTNALDRRYEEVLGFPSLGRSAMIGVRVTSRH
jgi:outer membrane receptor protein involved in Fe transport